MLYMNDIGNNFIEQSKLPSKIIINNKHHYLKMIPKIFANYPRTKFLIENFVKEAKKGLNNPPDIAHISNQYFCNIIPEL